MPLAGVSSGWLGLGVGGGGGGGADPSIFYQRTKKKMICQKDALHDTTQED